LDQDGPNQGRCPKALVCPDPGISQTTFGRNTTGAGKSSIVRYLYPFHIPISACKRTVLTATPKREGSLLAAHYHVRPRMLREFHTVIASPIKGCHVAKRLCKLRRISHHNKESFIELSIRSVPRHHATLYPICKHSQSTPRTLSIKVC